METFMGHEVGCAYKKVLILMGFHKLDITM